MTDQDNAKTELSEEKTAELGRFAAQKFDSAQYSTVMAQIPSKMQRAAIYIISALMLVFLIILIVGKINVVVIAPGKIMPKGKILNVQIPNTGVIESIDAKPGSILKKGQTIIKLSNNDYLKRMAALKRKEQLQMQKQKRLTENHQEMLAILSDPSTFLQKNKTPNLSDNHLSSFGDLRKSWIQLQHVKKVSTSQTLERKSKILNEIEAARQKIIATKNKRMAAENALAIHIESQLKKKKRLEEFKQLIEKGYYSSIDLENEEDKYRSALTAVREAKTALAQLDIEISEIEISLKERLLKLKEHKTSGSKTLQDAETNYKHNIGVLTKTAQRIETEIKSNDAENKDILDQIVLLQNLIDKLDVVMPADGIIGELMVNNPGDIVSAGSIVALIIPAGTPLIVKASVENKDIGFIKKDQIAKIKVSAYPYKQYGTVVGLVEHIYPNVGEQEQFTVILKMNNDYIKIKDKKFPLLPGMAVKADILTKKIRLIRLVIKTGKS